MQIHELNNYNGDIDSGAYLAIDNGIDTGKISVPSLTRDVEEHIADVNERVDNIIAGGDAPSAAEIIDARLGASDLGSNPYPSLGAAIRGQVSTVNAEVDYFASPFEKLTNETTAEGYIRLGIYSVGDIVSLTPSANYNFNYAVLECDKGEKFKITGTGGIESRLWGFLDESYILLQMAAANTSKTDFEVIAPQSGYFVFNTYVNVPYSVKRISYSPTGGPVSSTNVLYGDDKIADMSNIDLNNTGTITDGVFTQVHTGAGNKWWKLYFDPGNLFDNILKLVMNITSISGSGALYLIGYDSNNVIKYISLGGITTAKLYSFVIDLNYYVVYQNLDLSKPIYLGVANAVNEFTCVYDKIELYDYVNGKEKTSLASELNKINAELENETSSTSGVYLVSPNGSKYALQVANDGSLSSVNVIPAKSLFVGNSLLLGFTTFGMCATGASKDYYHYVSSKILSENGAATFSKLHGGDFEDKESIAAANTWISNTLVPALSNDLDLVVVQLGDNVNNASKLSTFTSSCKAMIDAIRANSPKARVAWVGEWYYTDVKQEIIKSACRKTGALFIDITDLKTDDNKAKIGDIVNKGTSETHTYAIDSYSDDAVNHKLTITFTVGGVQYSSVLPYSSYTDNGDNTLTVTGNYYLVDKQGEASHPGDAGMLAIANRICFKLGITDDENELS